MNTYESILARLRAAVPGEMSTLEGTFAGDILAAAATELARIHSQEIDTLAERAFVQSAQGQWLDAACAGYGVQRKAEEDDAGLRRRTLSKIRLQASSGNEAHYKAWAEELPGVKAAQAKGLARGPGTADVFIIPEDPQAGQALLDAVHAHIEGLRPICADTAVAFAQPVALDVSARLALATGVGLAGVSAQFEAALAEYLDQIALTERGALVSLTRVASLLLDCAGVLDVGELTLGGRAASLALPAGSYAVPGGCTLSLAVGV